MNFVQWARIPSPRGLEQARLQSGSRPRERDFGDVGVGDSAGGVEVVGEGAGAAEDLVVGAGVEAELLDGALEEGIGAGG